MTDPVSSKLGVTKGFIHVSSYTIENCVVPQTKMLSKLKTTLNEKTELGIQMH